MDYSHESRPVFQLRKPVVSSKKIYSKKRFPSLFEHLNQCMVVCSKNNTQGNVHPSNLFTIINESDVKRVEYKETDNERQL